MKTIINGETHYIVYAVYKGKNLQAWDLNDADWYETLRDALDAIGEARGAELWAALTGSIRDRMYHPEENEFAIMKVDLGPGANLWPVPVEIDTLGWQWANDEKVLKELEEAHWEKDGEDW